MPWWALSISIFGNHPCCTAAAWDPWSTNWKAPPCWTLMTMLPLEEGEWYSVLSRPGASRAIVLGVLWGAGSSLARGLACSMLHKPRKQAMALCKSLRNSKAILISEGVISPSSISSIKESIRTGSQGYWSVWHLKWLENNEAAIEQVKLAMHSKVPKHFERHCRALINAFSWVFYFYVCGFRHCSTYLCLKDLQPSELHTMAARCKPLCGTPFYSGEQMWDVSSSLETPNLECQFQIWRRSNSKKQGSETAPSCTLTARSYIASCQFQIQLHPQTQYKDI